ncbi:AI-2E family transporter [Anoxybacillus sp. J5B_2022]|nr:AI-2E family transporter [Anoxybacillus sp. J5B_2022]MCZ0756050.1 AI-2E family transporter [Anoxybacillus sp. J5B_2022]
MRVQNEQLRFFIRVTKLLFVVVLLYFIMRLKGFWLPILNVILTVLTPFLIAAFIAYLLHPIVESIHQKGLPRALAILMIYVLFFGGVGYGAYKGIPIFLKQLQEMTESLPMFVGTYKGWTNMIHDETSTWPEEIHKRVETTILEVEALLGLWLTKAVTSVKHLLNSAFVFLLVPFIAFYMLKDIELIKKAVWKLTPKKWRKEGLAFLEDIDESLGNYIRGQLLVCFLIGSVAALAFWIAGMNYPLLLGFIIGMTNVIPYFGPIIGAVPAVLLAATVSLKMVIIVISIIFVLQFLEGNILSPLIVGKSLHMHPLVIMFSLFLGGEIAGVIGMMIAVPFVAILKVSLLHAKERFHTH